MNKFVLSGDGERAMLQNRLEEVHHATSSTEVHHATSSTVSQADCEKSNIEVFDEPLDPDTRPVVDSGKIDVSHEENLIPPKKHILSMEVRSFIYI